MASCGQKRSGWNRTRIFVPSHPWPWLIVHLFPLALIIWVTGVLGFYWFGNSRWITPVIYYCGFIYLVMRIPDCLNPSPQLFIFFCYPSADPKSDRVLTAHAWADTCSIPLACELQQDDTLCQSAWANNRSITSSTLCTYGVQARFCRNPLTGCSYLQPAKLHEDK